MKTTRLFFLSATILFLVSQMSANAQIEGLALPADWSATINGETVTITYSGNKIVKSVKVKYKGEGFTTSEEGKRILFSKGNLQYHPKNNKWQFAEHQYDHLAREYNNHVNENTDRWIDLFGWGTADNPTLSTSSDSQYATYKEWGNKVSNSQTTWRTLKGREWWYILTERENAKNLYGVATVNENKGLIILPDNWVLPIGLTFKPGVSESSFEAYARNVYTIEQWEKMEAAGAVFLPVCGRRYGNVSDEMNVKDTDHGYYWASDYDNNTTDYKSKAYHVEIYWKYCKSQNNSQNRHYGSSVRLIKESNSMDTERSATQNYTTKKWQFYYYPGTTTTAHVEVEYEVGSVTASFSNNSYAYTGSEQKPNLMVLSGSTTLADTKYVVNYPDDITNVGEKTCTISVQNNGGGSFDINASFTITPKELTLSWGNTSFVYNGTEQKPTATVSGAVGNDAPTVTVSGGKINKGTYTATATLSSNPNSNYKLPTSLTKQFTIAQKELTLTWGSNTTFVYNGTEQKPTATVSGAVGNDAPTVTVSGGKINKGTYTATATLSSNPNSNYKLPTAVTKQFTINPKEVTIDWGETTFTYNGSAQKPTASVVSGLIGTDACLVTVTGEQTNAGSYTATASALSNTNYQLSAQATTQFTITAKTVSNPTIELSQASFTYDGTEKKPTVTVKDGTTIISSTEYKEVGYSNNKNAGTATVTIIDKENGNYTVNGTTTFSISKKAITASASANNREYNGTDVATGIINLDGVVEGDAVTTTYSSAAFADKNVGANKNVTFNEIALSGAAAGNYTLNNTTVTVKASITAKTLTFSSISAERKVYNGNAATTVTIIADNIVDGDEVSVSGTNVAFADKNVGENKTVSFTFGKSGADAANYVFENATGTATASITAKEVSLEWSNTTLTYNGENQKPTATVTNLVEGDDCAVTVSGEQKNANTYTATATALSNLNYKLPNDANCEFTILPKTGVVVTITENSGEFVYNTEEQSVSGYEVDINSELYTEADFTFSGSAEVKGKNAGEYEMNIMATDFSNTNTNFADVEFVIVDGALTITQAPEAPNKPEATMETKFISTRYIVLPEGWQWAENKELELGANIATANYEGADKGNYEVESVEITITRHECAHGEGTETLLAVEATCTTEGYSGDLCCKLCGMVYKQGHTTDALGHDFAETVVAPTCTAEGYTEHLCKRCQHIEYSDTVAATGHKADSVAFENVVEATRTTVGTYDSVVYCSVCHVELTRTTVEVPQILAETIKLTSKPNKVDYKQGEALDVKGGKIAIGYSDKSTEEFEILAGWVSGFDSQKVGEQKLTVTFESVSSTLTTTFNVTVSKADDNTNTAIDEDAANAVNIYAYKNTIVVENATDDILVYNTMGALICRDAMHCVRKEIIISTPGVYIVKTGNTAKRVMVY